jgi:chemotaxis protein CheX
MVEPAKPHLVISLGSAPSKASSAQGWGLQCTTWKTLIEGAARTVFETMLGSSLTRVDENQPAAGDVTAMVGLAGALVGVFSVRCTLPTANLLASRMLGVSTAEAESAARDALGEIANVVAGTLVTEAPGLKDVCFLSTPTVITGHDFKVYSFGQSTTVEVPFDFENARVWFCFTAM